MPMLVATPASWYSFLSLIGLVRSLRALRSFSARIYIVSLGLTKNFRTLLIIQMFNVFVCLLFAVLVTIQSVVLGKAA